MRSAVAVILLLCAASASAYPLIWAGISQDCAAIPANGYGPHEAPAADEQTVLTMKRLGSSVVKMCPGSLHKISAAFPEARQFLMTTSQGTFGGATTACPNRAVSPGPVQVGETELTLPCDASGTVRLSMISVAAAGSSKQYKQLSASVPVNPLSACPASPCHAAAASAAAAQAAKLENGGLNLNGAVAGLPLQKPDAAISVQLPAIPVAAPAPAAASNPSAAPDAAAAAPAAAAAAPVNDLLHGLAGLLKLPQLPQLNAGQDDAAAKPSGPNPAQLLGMLQKINDAAKAISGSGSAAAGGSAGAQNPLQVLGQVNATQLLTVMKGLGKLMPREGADGSPARVDIANVMEFVQSVGKILPGPGAASQSDAAPDLPTAVLNVVKSMGRLLPSDKPADLASMLNFVKSVGDLMGKLAAMRPAQ
uniref:Uncharacterized protein n=1 Tax=Tetradesmus obliquus TaxID=3088 RepID=A0A383WCX3_TETOB|eukprot:jgi/Sobl393_1/10051/SZX59694.1